MSKGTRRASAGAIICTFLAIWYSIEETLYKLLELDSSKLVKLNLKCFKLIWISRFETYSRTVCHTLGSDPTFSEIDKPCIYRLFV